MDALVVDIVRGTDENVASCLRIALERGWGGVLLGSFKEAKKRKDIDIDKICARHYSDFLTSVREMLDMREGSATHLTRLIREINDEIRETGKELVVTLTDLHNIANERENVRNNLENILEFKNIVLLMNKARGCIDNEDYYMAINVINNIDTVEKLKIAHIRPMMMTLQQWLPVVTAKLLHAVRHDCDSMISNNRHSHSVLLGTTLLRRFASTATLRDTSDIYLGKQLAKATELISNKICRVSPSISLAFVLRHAQLLHMDKWTQLGEFDASIPQSFIDAPEEEGNKFLDDFADEMPLSSLHKVIYSYNILGKIDQFYDNYRINRDMILPIMFEEAETNANNQGLASILPNLTANITGFFGMECLIRHSLETCEGAFAWMELHALWDKCCNYLHAFIGRHCDTIRFPDQLLQIKEELLLLAETVSDDLFEFRVFGLFETIRYLWSSFERLQLEYIVEACTDALAQSAFQPFYISTEEIYIQQIKAFDLERYLTSMNEDVGGQSSLSTTSDIGGKQGIRQSTFTLDELEEDMIGIDHTNMYSDVDVNVDDDGLDLPSMPPPPPPTAPPPPPPTSRTIPSQNTIDLDIEFDVSMQQHSSTQRPTTNISITNLTKNSSHQNQSNINSSVHAKFMPKNMPFSEAVPAIIRSMYVVLTRFFLFAARNPHLGSRGESICKSIQEAYHAVGKVLLKELLLNGNDTPLSKACQVSIDAAVFAKSSVVVYQLLEAMLKQFHWTDSLDSHLPMALQVINKNMVAISLQAQDMVFELLSRKIDDLLGSLVFINFNPTFQQHQGAVLDCHEEVNGIIDFLRVTLMWLTHLPHSAREAAHFTCCSKVANGLMEYLLSNKVATVNYIAIACFHADVKRLEAFAEECAIVHLGQCFAEFHDLIKAMLYADLGQLIENVSMRRQLFPRLDPLKLCILMDKVVPLPMGLMVPGLPRPDKNTLRGYVRKLRSQAYGK